MIHHKIKSAYHHIRHTRPGWYHEYHKWKHHGTLHWVTFGLSSFVIFLGFINAVMLMQQYPLKNAGAATTTVTANITGGILTIDAPVPANLSAVEVDVTTSQNSTGSLGTVTVEDNTGTGAGWSSTASSSHFYKYQNPATTSGVNSITLGADAMYIGTAGTYTIDVNSGGARAVATFDVAGPGADNATNVPMGAGNDIAIGANGLSVDFPDVTYLATDQWTIRVDTLPVTGFRITPGSLTANFGSSTTNVNAGSQHTFSGTNDPTSLITATAGYGMGSYSVTPDLQLTVPANSYANSYTATMTITVSGG